VCLDTQKYRGAVMESARTREFPPEWRRWRWLVTSLDGPKSPVQRLILVVLFDYWVSSPTREIFPSEKTIAEKVGVTDRAIRSNLRVLREAGWIRIGFRDRGGQGWRRYEYQLCWPQGVDPGKDPWLAEVRQRRDEARAEYREEQGWPAEA
jgi:hypothetical protein